jgi:hypothetical protein
MNVKAKKDRLDDAHARSLPQLPNGQSHWDASAPANGWPRNFATPATESPASNLPWFEKSVILT